MKATLRDPARGSEILMVLIPLEAGHKWVVLTGNFASTRPKAWSLCWYQELPQPRCGTLVELYEVCTRPLLKAAQVPLNGILSLRHVNHTTELDVFCKFDESALNLTVYDVADEGIK